MISEGSNSRLREPVVAGRFYPAGRDELQAAIREYFREAKPACRPGVTPRAIIVPHAGYLFSGTTAASGYNQLSEGAVYDRVIILASSHQMHFHGTSVYHNGNYRTPLGIIETDSEAARKLLDSSALFSGREDAHLHEHSLEVQLPFLQMRLSPGFKIVPLILGTHDPAECRRIADALNPFFVEGTLFVVSSDFSHYPDYDDARITDRKTTEAILSLSPEELLKTLEANKAAGIPGLVTSLCGWTSVLTFMYLVKDSGLEAEWVDYSNSGDQPLYGDHDRVVGYCALAFFDPHVTGFNLTDAEKAILLQIASVSIEASVEHGGKGDFAAPARSGTISSPAGAFVSIYIAGKLRGCTGSFESNLSLAEVVYRSAASATRDSRFKAPLPEELEDLTVEISVLTPLRRIYSPEEIEPGRHGIYIRKGFSAGTFLPQVGSRYGWTKEELLGRCSRDKAGLGWDGWKDAELFTYEAIVFNAPFTRDKSGEGI